MVVSELWRSHARTPHPELVLRKEVAIDRFTLKVDADVAYYVHAWGNGNDRLSAGAVWIVHFAVPDSQATAP